MRRYRKHRRMRSFSTSSAPRLTSGTSSISTYGRPRRRLTGVPLLLGILVVAGLIAGGVLFYQRPVEATFAATPTDCTVSACDLEGSGELSVADLEPGSYDVTVERVGFKPLSTQVDVTRFGTNEFAFDLEPRNCSVSLLAHPDDAICRITAQNGDVLSGEGSVDGRLPAGSVTIEVTCPGRNTYTRDFFLDSSVDLEVWLDPEGQLVSCQGILQSAGAPKSVQITPDGRELWATVLDGPPSIEIWDMGTMGLLDTIDLGANGAVEIIFSSDGATAYASQMETAQVFEIDTATRAVKRTFDTESSWTKVVELSPDEKTLYAANWSGDDVSVIDLESGTLRTRIATADTPADCTRPESGTSLYVAGFGGGELERIDLSTGTVTELFDSNGALRHIAGDAQRGLLFISDMASDCIWIHNMTDGTTTKFVDTDAKPNTIALSPDGRILYVSCRGENNPSSYYIPGPEWGTMLMYDTASGEPIDAIVGGNQCTALDVSDDGSTLVFSDFLDARMRVYSVPPFEDLTDGAPGRWDEHLLDLVK